MGKTEFNYSIELVEAALLNRDGTVPSPNDWSDTHPQTGEVRNHKGGLVGFTGTVDIDGWSGKDLKVGVRYGTKKGEFTFASTAVNKKACTVAEMVKDLNTGFATLTASGIKFEAKSENGYLKIIDKEAANENKLPFYAPVGFSGRLAERLGIVGWVSNPDIKSFKDDPEKESGKSVEATGGRGIRCSIKDPDTIKGINITIALAGQNSKFQAMLSGDTYNEETDEYYSENKEAPPFAARYFVRQFEEGTNTKSSNDKMRVFCFPSCQITPGGQEATEGNIAGLELSGSCSENKASNLQMKFHKGVSIADYKRFVEA